MHLNLDEKRSRIHRTKPAGADLLTEPRSSAVYQYTLDTFLFISPTFYE